MARIRTIKPEYWSSPGMAGLDPWARLLFIAMWNWADDTGRGIANARELAGFAFPLDEEISSADIRRMLVEIRRAFGVVFYEVGGRPYYWLPSWDKHQKIDKRSGSKYPGPDDGKPWDPDPSAPTGKPSDLPVHVDSWDSAESSEGSAEFPSSPRRTSGAGTGEQGNRGTGESTSVLSVGERTDRNAREGQAPSAQPEISFVARSVIAGIPRYEGAPPWARKLLARLAQRALDDGFGRDAITRMAGLVASEARFLVHQHIPEFREVLRRLARDRDIGDLCPTCGAPGCIEPHAPAVEQPVNRPWTEQDQADFEAAVRWLKPTHDELAAAGNGP